MKTKEFLKELEAYHDSLRQKLEAAFDGWDDSPEAVLSRRTKVLDPVSGFDFFVNNYFPHYVRSSSRSALHHFLFEQLPLALQKPASVHMAVAAPVARRNLRLFRSCFHCIA